MDSWKHRSRGMRCGSCMFFVAKISEKGVNEDITTPSDSRGKIGRCRRHAPTMNGYPAVFESDWCGDHKLDENKL